ncbi:hypothetical protein X474_01180 [Dethiosulfatarculus sandiegensis]|uniref:Uncharacterized protein n=1 Tax=Dethiosulfatarculus sandiegensis TaxID=1429043 RepID=A0A0D2JKC0_9BACT|nr:hypothetical protein X474_01180 [Dethiosulfatarculus sandiegensis]
MQVVEFKGPFTLLSPEKGILFDCPEAGEPGLYIWAVKMIAPVI